jgi:hypothetical protein
MAAGGTCVVTVDRPLASTGYTRYSVRGQSSNASEAYRRLNIKNTYVAQHLTSQFNYSVPWSTIAGSVTLVNYPQGVICGVSAGVKWQVPAQFELIPYDGTTDGYIRFYEPWVRAFNSDAILNAGGAGVQQATDIMMLVPYSRGTMTAVYPSSGYAGTAYTRFNVQRQLVRDYNSWWDQGSVTAMTTLAQEIHATVANAVQEGQVTIRDQYLTALTPGAPIALNIANFVGTTGFESMAAPVRTVVLEWMQGSGAAWNTKLHFSTRRQQYSGDRLYVHPSYAAAQAGGATLAASISLMGGNVLESAFINANMGISPEFMPMMGQRELRALGAAQFNESYTLGGMMQAESDQRAANALGSVMQAEATAAGQVGVNQPAARLTPMVPVTGGAQSAEATSNLLLNQQAAIPANPFAGPVGEADINPGAS